MLAPPLWSTISTVMGIGFTARQAIPICFFGFLICGGVIGLTRSTFSLQVANWQSHRCHVSRSFSRCGSCRIRHVGLYSCNPDQNLCRFDGKPHSVGRRLNFQWTAITTVQGGGYLENMVTAIWPSYANFPNKLPASANITSGSLLMVFLYWFVQTGVSMLPMYRLRYFFAFKAIVVPPAFLALFLWG